MREYIVVPQEILDQPEKLAEFLSLSLQYAKRKTIKTKVIR